MTKRKYVDVTVSWCNDDCAPTAKVSLTDWESVCAGEGVTVGTSYWYEGKRYPASFAFNHPEREDLTVFGVDGTEPYSDGIEHSLITGGTYTPAGPEV
jgi:hypothetical protein